MACTAGKDGVVKLAKQKIGYIDNWSLSINGGTAEVSQMGDDWKDYCETAKDWSGSASGTFDYADAQQKKIVDAIIAKTPLDDPSMEFFCGSTLTLAGKVIITSVSITAAHADKIALSFNFQGKGALAPAEVV